MNNQPEELTNARLGALTGRVFPGKIAD